MVDQTKLANRTILEIETATAGQYAFPCALSGTSVEFTNSNSQKSYIDCDNPATADIAEISRFDKQTVTVSANGDMYEDAFTAVWRPWLIGVDKGTEKNVQISFYGTNGTLIFRVQFKAMIDNMTLANDASGGDSNTVSQTISIRSSGIVTDTTDVV